MRDSHGVPELHELIQAMDEFMSSYVQTINYRICKGIDGKYYAVFADFGDLYAFDIQFKHYFQGCRIASFGQHENAFELGVLH